MTGFIGGVRRVVLGVILHAGFIGRLKFKKTGQTGCMCQFVILFTYASASMFMYVCFCQFMGVCVCQWTLKCALGETNHSGKFVYPVWADVKTQSALNGQTKHTHLAEIKQKLSWPPLSLRSPSTLCLSMPSPLQHNVFRNVALPQPLRLCNAFCYTTPISLIHVFEYATSPQTRRV